MSIKIEYIPDDDGIGKTKGVWVEETNEIPQIVGLSKKQFFGFLIASLLMGAGIFGIGYTLAFFKSEEMQHTKNKKHKEHQPHQGMKIAEGIALGSAAGYASSQLSSLPSELAYNTAAFETASEIYGNAYFVLLGMFKNEPTAKLLAEKLKQLGKKATIKTRDLHYIVYLGPFNSKTLAQNEVDSIAMATSLNASITRVLP